MKNKIVLEADTELKDNKLRRDFDLIIGQIDTKIRTLNDRTKIHTIDIQKIKKEMKDSHKD